jgi:hypothetical protein
MRLAVLLGSVLLAAGCYDPSSLCDCAATCEDLCTPPEPGALFEAVVVDNRRLLVRLTGKLTDQEVDAQVGDEFEVYTADVDTRDGDKLIMVVADYTDGTPGSYAWNIALPIRPDGVDCPQDGPLIPVGEFVTILASNDCPAAMDRRGVAFDCCA